MTDYAEGQALFGDDEQLRALAEAGDVMATRSLCCLELLCQGWRYGDPDPSDDEPPPSGGTIVELRLAA